MRSKALAERTIVLLVVGIIVLGLAIYLVYTVFIGGSGTLSEEKCKGIMTNRCVMCSIGTSDCKLSSSELGCVEILRSIGIIIDDGGSFVKSECSKVGITAT